MDLPIVVPLSRPITFEGVVYDSLSFDEADLDAQIAYAELEATFPEPEMVVQGDGKAAPVYPALIAAKVNRFWLARLSGLPEAVIGKLKGSDIPAANNAAEIVMGLDGDAGSGGASGNASPAK